MKLYKTLIGILGLFLSSSLYANDHQYTTESEQLLEQLQGNIKGTLLAVAENEKKAGYDMANFRFSVEFPPQQMTNLGLILDVDRSAEGYKVLSVTPGSTADKLAIKSGDKILAINDVKINKANNEKTISQLNQLVAGEQIKLALNTNGNYKELSTKIAGQYIPGVKLEIGSQALAKMDTKTAKISSAVKGCGQVTVFFDPPQAREIYPAVFNKIGKNHGIRNWHSFRLPVGKHTIYLHEHIYDTKYLLRRIGRQKAKPIEIDVKANTSYHLGAKFIRANRFKTAKGRHWEPVVWKTSESNCKL